MEKADLKIGSKLYAYEINRGWSRNALVFEFTITRETNTMWILSINGKEYQKIKKDTLYPHGKGKTVSLQRDDELEKIVKEYREYLYLMNKIRDIERKLRNKDTVPEELRPLYDFLKEEDHS